MIAHPEPGLEWSGSAFIWTKSVESSPSTAVSCARNPAHESRDLNRPHIQMKKEVTPEAFASFLSWLGPDSHSAGEEYERLRFRLCTFFSQRRCRFPDELADETINRLIQKSATEDIEHKMAYCYGVARNIYRESLRKERPQVDLDEVRLAAAGPPEEPSFSHDCLDQCLAKLPAESSGLLLDYFSEATRTKIELHRSISARLQTTQTALRMRILRIKLKLKLCVEECMT